MKISRGDIFRVGADGERLRFDVNPGARWNELHTVQLKAGTLLQVRRFLRAGRPAYNLVLTVLSGDTKGVRVFLKVYLGHEENSLKALGLIRLSALEQLASAAR